MKLTHEFRKATVSMTKGSRAGCSLGHVKVKHIVLQSLRPRALAVPRQLVLPTLHKALLTVFLGS